MRINWNMAWKQVYMGLKGLECGGLEKGLACILLQSKEAYRSNYLYHHLGVLTYLII